MLGSPETLQRMSDLKVFLMSFKGTTRQHEADVRFRVNLSSSASGVLPMPVMSRGNCSPSQEPNDEPDAHPLARTTSRTRAELGAENQSLSDAVKARRYARGKSMSQRLTSKSGLPIHPAVAGVADTSLRVTVRKMTRPRIVTRNSALVTTVPRPSAPWFSGWDMKSPMDAPSGRVRI